MVAERSGKSAVYERLAGVAKALGNATRLELLELVSQGEQSVEGLARLSGTAVTTTSANLQVLRRFGLVATRRQGSTVFYSLAADDVATLMVVLKAVGLNHSTEVRSAWSDQERDGAPTVSSEIVRGDASALFILDVRPAHEFAAGHFPGAVSVPLEDLATRTDEIPLDRKVVVYCRGEFCTLARQAAVMLRDRGVDAAAMDEGIMEWRADNQVVLDASA